MNHEQLRSVLRVWMRMSTPTLLGQKISITLWPTCLLLTCLCRLVGAGFPRHDLGDGMTNCDARLLSVLLAKSRRDAHLQCWTRPPPVLRTNGAGDWSSFKS